ncbi:hypothetical protein PTR77_08520 [Serratia bockelmannii]|uniref:hypothetical protein n=1 Tax=Serratia bockelmannii TaxID=2703793 RepID=UPI00313C956C
MSKQQHLEMNNVGNKVLLNIDGNKLELTRQDAEKLFVALQGVLEGRTLLRAGQTRTSDLDDKGENDGLLTDC